MDSRIAATGAQDPDAIEFVRFCYRRRRVGWPELYDEMCQVASRGAFRGWGTAELADHGIGFSLFQTPLLAQLVRLVLEAEGEPPRPVTMLARRPAPRDHDDDSAVERRRTLVRAMGAA